MKSMEIEEDVYQHLLLSTSRIGESASEILYPKQIPGTGYWVVTNNDTPKEGRILEDVMRLLGYAKPALEEALSALA